MPALAMVVKAVFKASDVFPVTTAYMVLYMPAPGTSGIRQHITKVVTGVFNILAKISEYILKTIEEKNMAIISETPSFKKIK